MPVIRFAKPRPELQISAGENLMQALLAAGLPVASTCGGDAVCAKCGIHIVAGAENLSPPSEREIFLKEQNNLRGSVRISCQILVWGDIIVDAGYW